MPRAIDGMTFTQGVCLKKRKVVSKKNGHEYAIQPIMNVSYNLEDAYINVSDLLKYEHNI